MRTLLSTVMLAALLCFTASQARAQDDDAEVTRMAKEHYKAGLEAYKNGKYNVAIKELQKAYLLKRLPALLLNIGATYRKMGEYDNALHYYQKYLDEAPADAKDRGEVQNTMAEIQKEKNAPPPSNSTETTAPPETHGTEAPPPVREQPMPKEWTHAPIDAAPPEQPIDVRVSMPVMKGVKVYVYYRTAGQADFTTVLMKRRGNEKVGRIPADAVNGKALQYYIEAKDPSGAVVKSSGSKDNPNIVMLEAGAPSQVLASVEGSQASETRSEEPTGTGRSLDDETAPMTGQLKTKKGGTTTAKRPSGGGGSSGGRGTLFWAGIVIGGVGIASLAGGIAGLVIAKQKSDYVSDWSKNPIDPSTNAPAFYNNDPTATNAGIPQFAAEADAGKLANSLGIAFTTIGVLATVTGGILMIVDLMSTKKVEQPKRRTAAIDGIYITPVTGPKVNGVVAGFSF
jgi:Tetratricopeptide repeat